MRCDAIGGIDNVNDGNTAMNNVLKIFPDNDNATHAIRRDLQHDSGKTYILSFVYFIPETNSNVNSLQIGGSKNGEAILGSIYADSVGKWTSFEYIWRPDNSNATTILMRSNQNTIFAGAGTENDDIIYIKDINLKLLPDASDSQFNWLIPDEYSSDCLVRVSDYFDLNTSDRSNFSFTIIPRLYLTSPIGGENWGSGTKKTITWLSSEVDSVRLEFSDDNGSTWTEITIIDGEIENYTWETPGVLSDQCLIRITSLDGVYSYQSRSVFTLYESNINMYYGEIAFVGYNFSNTVPNEFAFVILNENGLPANSIINFTDRGVFSGDNSLDPRRPAGSFVDKVVGEGELIYVAPNDIPPGTVISWRIDQTDPDFLYNGLDPSAIGEQLIAYQFDEGIDTTFLFALNNELVGPEKWQSDINVAVPSNAPFRSNLPPGLTDSVNAIAFDVEVDNRVYIGGDKPTVQELLAAIVDENNWTGDDVIGQEMPDINLITSVDEVYSNKIPSNFELYQNFPNPFNPSTKIRYSIPNESFVSIKLYNSLGEQIETLVYTNKSPGTYEVTFDAANLSSGIYIYKMTAGNFTSSKKLVILK